MTDEGWIDGAELAALAAPAFGTTGRLKDWLMLRLASGRVSAKARTCLLAGTSGAAPHRIDDWQIPPETWSFISLADDGADRADLSDDLDQLTGPRFPPGHGELSYPPRRFECRGLSYARDDLGAVLGPMPKPVKARERGTGGRRPDKQKWVEFAAAFAVIADRDGIEVTEDAAQIYEQIADFLALNDLEGFHIENVRDAITLAQDWRRGGKLKI